MSNKEVRYAIIIGVNDYKDNPLNFCVNDAIEVKKALINSCKFDEKNIFMITSDDTNSNKDITGKYLEAIRNIKVDFRANEDSILFYFAGHGSCNNNKSVVWLQESPYPIEEVFNDICLLNPKVQTYIIDSCASGSKVLTRNKESELEKYIKSSKGAMFLYACQNTENAQELSKLEHGLLTYKILKAIGDKNLYDEKGYLTFNRIVDYVQRETSLDSGFTQIPVIENNIVGFYPFAIDEDKIVNDRSGEETDINIQNNISELKDIRASLMCKAVEKLNKELDMIQFSEYKTTYVDNFNKLDYIGVSNLKEKIVEYVVEQKLIPLNNLIYKEVEKKKYDNPLFGSVLKQMDLMNNVPSEITKYFINFESDELKSKFKLFISKKISEVSFGIGYINYQAKWGIVALKIAFLIDWDGEKYNIIKDINIDYLALSLEKESIEAIENIQIGFEVFLKSLVDNWNYDREEELKKYRMFLNKI